MMTKRLAAAMALLAFAGCLVSGMRAENTFETTVVRSLEAKARHQGSLDRIQEKPRPRRCATS
jgi:hypothetical protein